MNKDHKKVLAGMKLDYNSASEDKAFMHDELVKAKSINKTLMYELD